MLNKQVHITDNILESTLLSSAILEVFGADKIQSINYYSWSTYNTPEIIQSILDVFNAHYTCQYVYCEHTYGRHEYLYKSTYSYLPVVGYLHIDGDSVRFTVYSVSIIDGEVAYAELFNKLSEIINQHNETFNTADVVKVHFCYQGLNGNSIQYERFIECCSWEDIQNNYIYNKPELEQLFSNPSPDYKGKFIFWYGDVGTGKSYLIRSLIKKWKNISKITYIIDPENFFQNAHYMYNIILDDEEDGSFNVDAPLSPSFGHRKNRGGANDKFHVFIIEDGLDLLLSSSRQSRNPEISRFLNLIDGILGQGLRILFLVTTNEKLDVIDPAFLRPGRCLQEVEFKRLRFADAQEWVRNQIKDNDLCNIKLQQLKNKEYSLAELYAFVNDNNMFNKRNKIVGFNT